MFLKGVPIAPRFNPICFAHSLPLVTYIVGPKGKALHLLIKCFIFGTLNSFNVFFVMSQLNWFIAKKKNQTCEAPPTN